MRRARWTAGALGLLLGLAGSAARADETGSSERQPSRLKALGASLLLPGLGQHITGHPTRARFFFAVEGAIVIGFVTSEVQGATRKQSYIEYAERFAGVSEVEDKPDWYYRNLGRFPSSDEYLDEIAITARGLYGDDLEQREAYIARNAPGPGEEWRWRSDADRQEFRDRRQASRNALHNADLFLGAALLNRVLSAVDAARLAGQVGPRSTFFYRPGEDGSGYLCMQWKLD
jgi:hypothetical protein